MINRINSKDSLKQEYPKSIDAPSLSESLLQRQAKSVEEQMRRMEVEVREKMASLKNRRIDRKQLEEYEKEIKAKMKEVERAVRSAFEELHKKGKFS
jgi:DnaJ-domain-containing protein 1